MLLLYFMLMYFGRSVGRMFILSSIRFTIVLSPFIASPRACALEWKMCFQLYCIWMTWFFGFVHTFIHLQLPRKPIKWEKNGSDEMNEERIELFNCILIVITFIMCYQINHKIWTPHSIQNLICSRIINWSWEQEDVLASKFPLLNLLQ